LRLLKNHYFIALQYEKKGEIKKAIQIYWELIKSNKMGRRPYDRLRILYAKQKNWDNAIKICHKFIDTDKLSKKQCLHPGFTINLKKDEAWIRKYERNKVI